jgi:CRISPR/Cas system CSM-associated protein Csm2 small subunit
LLGSKVNIPCSVVDENVRKVLATLAVDATLYDKLYKVFGDEVKSAINNVEDDSERLQRELLKIDQEEERTLRIVAAGQVSQPVWERFYKEIDSRRRAIRQELDSMNIEFKHIMSDLDYAIQVISQVHEIYDKLGSDEQQQLLGLIFKQVVVDVDGNIVRLVFHPPFGYVLKKRNEILASQGQVAEQSKQIKSATRNGGASENQFCLSGDQISWETWTRTKNDGTRIRSFAN